MPYSKVYDCLVAKAERKGRTKAEVDDIINWLTGYEKPAEIGKKNTGKVPQNCPYHCEIRLLLPEYQTESAYHRN